MDHIFRCTDLRREDLDLEEFAHALALQHLRMLISNRGSDSGRPDLGDVLSPHHLEAFLARVVETVQKTKRFKREWGRLCWLIPCLQDAWEQGQVRFHDDPHRARANEEEMKYRS